MYNALCFYGIDSCVFINHLIRITHPRELKVVSDQLKDGPVLLSLITVEPFRKRTTYALIRTTSLVNYDTLEL